MNMPLVSILIPTYNRPVYFKQALISALRQSYQNTEIIICDDSTNDFSKKIAINYQKKFPNKIKYYKNKINLGGKLNFQLALQKAKGEYVNYLMDDDLFHPHKIERMIDLYLKDSTSRIKLVTSYRQPIDAEGNYLADFSFTKKKFDCDTIMKGIDAGSSIILDGNWIGEPTTPLFKKSDLIEPFGYFHGSQYQSAVDMASWLSLLSNGDIAYIADTLSYLRMHSDNAGKNVTLKIKSAYDWIHMLFHCPQKNILSSSNDLNKSVQECKNFIKDLSILFSNQITPNQKQILNHYNNCLHMYEQLLTQEQIN
ncbi:glycosyltransferase family 2 protein [Bacillus thuringiensis]|uniref:glycosyltransferase family 2 protein n=1 Tax=Bacillus thuringiensis TaxID=1428 RepID=UPI00119ED937|nr:glycosyltransferase [Bacillus thuringiensis]